ncbi:MAG: MalY/PatB family protein [Prevotella sp.]
MKYDFDQVVNRRGSGCYKWDSESPLPVVDGPQPEDNVTNDIIPMWVADMDFQVAPAIREALQRRVEHGVFGYTLVPDSYYQAIINWFRRRHDWQIEREWIMYTTGVVPALSVIVKAFTQPGDQVILQTPVYNCFFSSVRNNGCEVVESPLIPASSFSPSWKYTMDFADLEAKVRHPRAKLLILCNPHNPVGRVWTREELARIARICKENDVIVVADEIHNELCFRGRRYVPYGTIDTHNAIICTSPSKSFNTAGLQNANIICARPEWREKIDRAINVNEVCDVNPFGVVALEAAYNESEAWLDELCEYIYQNYEALCQFFARELPQLSVTPLEGTYLVWVDIRPTGLGSDELTQRLLKEGRVQVNSSTMYGCEGYIRLNIACPRSQMMEGLRRIKKVVDQL